MLLNADLTENIVCCHNTTSFGFLNISRINVVMEGTISMPITLNVQKSGDEEISQPYNANKVKAIDTKLRRRLSNIFHLDNPDNGFFLRFLSGPGTRGNNQEAICQSPLTHL